MSFPSNTTIQCSAYRYPEAGNPQSFALFFFDYGVTYSKLLNNAKLTFTISDSECTNYTNPTVQSAVVARLNSQLAGAIIKHENTYTSNTEEIQIVSVVGYDASYSNAKPTSFINPDGGRFPDRISVTVNRGYNGTTPTADVVYNGQSTLYIEQTTQTFPVSVSENLNLSNNLTASNKLSAFLSDIISLTSHSVYLSTNVLKVIINDFIVLRNNNEHLKIVYNGLIQDTIYLFNNALCYDWTTTFRICNEYIMLKNYDSETIKTMTKVLEVILNDFVLFKNNADIKTYFQAKVIDNINLTDLSSSFRNSVIILNDDLTLSSSVNTQATFKEFLMDYLRTSVLINFDNEIYEVYAINLENKALTRYDNYDFNSFATLKNKHYGMKKDGIYILDSKDGDEEIKSSFKTGFLNSFSKSTINEGSDRRKMERVALLRFKSDGSSIFRIYNDEGETFDYNLNVSYNGNQSEVKFGRGLRGTIFQVEIESTGKFDLLGGEIIPVILKRRV